MPDDLIDNSSNTNSKVLPSCWFTYSYSAWNSIRKQDTALQEWRSCELPGIYVLTCLKNGRQYFGESGNIKSQYHSTYSTLTLGTHISKACKDDWNTFGPLNFRFTVVYI